MTQETNAAQPTENEEGRKARRKLPDFFYNWISAAGALLALVVFTVIVMLTAIDMMSGHASPYLALLTYLMLPGVLVFGLALVAFGALFTRYRLARGHVSVFPTELSIDLRNVRHRNAIFLIIVVGTVFGLATAIGSFKAFEATESVVFCGKLCHEVMKPEYETYHTSTHARVACVACHIGPGAEWFVKAKVNGLRQIYATAFDKFPRPIPTPIHNLRPASETCLECHWPDKFFGARDMKRPHFLADEANTPYPIRLSVKIGGGTSAHTQMDGVHWHVKATNKVEYIARDHARLDIPWVRMTNGSGEVTVFEHKEKPLTAEEIAKAQIRTMDCMDCHNRPAHNYRPPMHTVNEAIDSGAIARELPFVKRETMRALDKEYESTPKALAAIEAHLLAFYKDNHPEVFAGARDKIDRAIAETQRIYAGNIFPEMKVTWRKYPSHLGHSLDLGCFRCHGGELEAKGGAKITHDCTVCHTLLAQGASSEVELSPAGLVFKHPVDIDGAEKTGKCTDCHTGGAELY